MNILEALEIINTAEENTQQIQVLPGSRSILPSKMSRNEIITSDAVYKTAHGILSRGMNAVSLRMLHFLCASLCAAARADGSVRECAARARKLLLRSGCLQDMLDMFLGSTNNENLKVLCECLVESCRDCEENQNYCSCLIPACVQRHNAMKMEIIKLLHCLLINNTSNINLFVESNGISIFTKDSIHDSSRMELLSVVVQNSYAANILKRDTDLLNSLILVREDYKENCEGSWKMVELTSVILFHLASQIEGDDNTIGTTINKSDFDREMSSSETTLCDLTVSFLMKRKSEIIESRNVDDRKLEYSTTTKNGFCFKPVSGDHMSFPSSTIIDFMPKFVSTPKRRITTTIRHVAELRKELTNCTTPKSNNKSHRVANEKKPASLVKKTLSTSARLLNIMNNSCISIYHAIGTIFSRNSAKTKSENILKQKCKVNEGLMNKFINYMKRDTKVSDNLNATRLRPKLATKQNYRKGIVKKLKIGMHFYGCNFKKIAQAMWPHEKQMTPKVLCSIYRKFIAK